MARRITVKKHTFILFMLFTILILVFSLAEKVDLLFTVTFLLWSWLFLFSVINLKESPLLFCFLLSFFVFLLGRQLCFHFFHIEQVYEFLDVVNEKTYLCLLISLLGIALGLGLSKKKRQPQLFILPNSYDNCTADYKSACKTMFFCCYLASIYGTFLQIRYVQRVGYLASYTGEAGGAGIPTIVSYLSRFTIISFSMYLATKPSKREAIFPIILYEGYAVLTILTGQRYPFIGISMFILVYYILRSKDEKKWMKRSYYILLIAAVPVLMLLLTAYDAIRLGNSFSVSSLKESFLDFLVQQGGSVNTIRRTIYNAEQLKDMHFVSLSGIYSAIFENAISRRLFHITTYSGNSIETAFHSRSLAHRLSYIAYGNEYLNGRGTGTSYIAELLHDFGFAGIFGGSVLYGYLLDKVDKVEFRNVYLDAIKIAMVYYLIFAPRGSFDSFIGSIFNLYTIMGFTATIMLSLLFQVFPRKNRKNCMRT